MYYVTTYSVLPVASDCFISSIGIHSSFGSDFDTIGTSLTGVEIEDTSSSSSIWTETSVSKMKSSTIKFLYHKYAGKMENCQSLYFLDRQIVAVRRYDNRGPSCAVLSCQNDPAYLQHFFTRPSTSGIIRTLVLIKGWYWYQSRAIFLWRQNVKT